MRCPPPYAVVDCISRASGYKSQSPNSHNAQAMLDGVPGFAIISNIIFQPVKPRRLPLTTYSSAYMHTACNAVPVIPLYFWVSLMRRFIIIQNGIPNLHLKNSVLKTYVKRLQLATRYTTDHRQNTLLHPKVWSSAHDIPIVWLPMQTRGMEIKVERLVIQPQSRCRVREWQRHATTATFELKGLQRIHEVTMLETACWSSFIVHLIYWSGAFG